MRLVEGHQVMAFTIEEVVFIQEVVSSTITKAKGTFTVVINAIEVIGCIDLATTVIDDTAFEVIQVHLLHHHLAFLEVTKDFFDFKHNQPIRRQSDLRTSLDPQVSNSTSVVILVKAILVSLIFVFLVTEIFDALWTSA